MKILILGGSGILSTDFTNYAISNNDEVYILNRGKRKPIYEGEKIHPIIADLRNDTIEDVREKIKGTIYDAVIDYLSFNISQIQKTLAIVSGLFNQYVFISSATAYIKKRPDEIITESSPVGNKRWDYAYKKAECELYLKTQEINYTIIRPYVTFGNTRIPFPIIPDGYHFTLLERIIENKPVVLYNDGAAVCTLTSTKDFAIILYRLLLNPKAYKEDFHITSSSRQSWKDVYLMYCEILNRKPNFISVEFDQVIKYLPEFADILEGDKGMDMLFDNSKVLNAVGGYEFEIGLRERLEESINYFLSNKFMQGIDYKWEGRCDYLIKKVTGLKPSKLSVAANAYSNSPGWYYVMSTPILRKSFEIAKKIKKNVRDKGEL